MKLIVGLGNPGIEYASTRHNIGYRVIEEFARSAGFSDDFQRDARKKFDGLVLSGSIGAEKILLLEPLTYMNLSGRAVQAAMAFYQLSPPELMVVLDDIALPCGRIRLRAGGSSGGHNGLKDIERALGTSEYPRLRLGIDSPGSSAVQKDYVLGKFSQEQRQQIDSSVGRAAGAIRMWIDEGISKAMSVFNAGEKET